LNAGAHAIVIGRSNIVGKPMAQLLLAANCTVTIAHSRTRDTPVPGGRRADDDRLPAVQHGDRGVPCAGDREAGRVVMPARAVVIVAWWLLPTPRWRPDDGDRALARPCQRKNDRTRIRSPIFRIGTVKVSRRSAPVFSS
jgi:hypothetical protein